MNARDGSDWMWSEACALLDSLERRQRHLVRVVAAPSSSPAWEAPTNIFASGSELQITLALPGARADQIRIELNSRGLQVETVVPAPVFAEGMNVVRLEIPYGRMVRRIDLPPGRFALLEHRFEHGCLYLKLQRSIP